MKKILVFLLISMFLFSFQCTTNSIIIKEPEHQPLPHPEIPDLNTNTTVPELMNNIIILMGAIEKYEYLVEIYEREYLHIKYNNEKFKEKTLEELKNEYLQLIKGVSSENSN